MWETGFGECLERDARPGISIISQAELDTDIRPAKRAAVGSLLTRVSVNEDIARIAGTYKRDYSRSHGVLMPDALIAATARCNGEPLDTCNGKHFPMRDIKAHRP